MTQAPEVWLSEVRRIVLKELRGYQAEVYLYGSWARGTQRRSSDLDVGILPKERIPVGLLAHMTEALEESTVPYPVEVVDLTGSDDAFRERVRREGIRWAA